MNRPNLTKDMNVKSFLQYYYLKAELTEFCKENGLSAQSGKPEMTERIAHLLKTGEKKAAARKKKMSNLTEPTLDTLLEKDRKYDEIRRRFFEQHVGSSFHFTVKFQRWLAENAGEKTYREAVKVYRALLSDETPTTIGRQFEYNSYIRAFFCRQ